MDDLKTNAEITWCPGCGNFGIKTAIQNAILELEKEGMNRRDFVITTGIGCHAKMFDYLNLSGIYGLHGRNSSNAEGIKLANPDLKVITFSGDGNGLAEGLEHTLFAAKRNQDITMILHNNSVYALTTGQYSPLTEPGWKGPSTPKGSFEIPFYPVSLLIEAGATFVARCYSGDIKHLTETLIKAIKHKGFSFIEVLQPAVTYHKWEEYKDNIEYLNKQPTSLEEAMITAKKVSKFTIGTFYQSERGVYHKGLYGELNPVKDKLPRDKRLDKIREILQ
ncbi:MAG: thiamine pyrophosphate-dependent enzyme [Candidatus Thorarchaeota archaeon]